MKKIVVIGAGFAGLTAAMKLKKCSIKKGFEVTLVSDKDDFTFLPMLPDCLGQRIKLEHLAFEARALSHRYGFDFVKDKVVSVDLEKKIVSTTALELDYDYLVIASGSQTNFYGNRQIEERAFKLDDVFDARLIRGIAAKHDRDAYIVSGAGYTGIEVATHLKAYFKKNNLNKRVIIVERAHSILAMLEPWMRDYCLDNLKSSGIEVSTDTAVTLAGEKDVALSDGRIFDNALLIWASGVRCADFIQNLPVPKNQQGRIIVDRYLRLNDSCFAAGDACYFKEGDNFLRMAVQFAIMEGLSAAGNIIRSIQGRKLLSYRPVDLGFIIPMANYRSCGRILGINMKGRIPTAMHYLMCIYRVYGFKNKIGIISDLIKALFLSGKGGPR
ncbi:MAG: FAD-dependent oxidoreductase [Candidatus Omnitrophota bacterium]